MSKEDSDNLVLLKGRWQDIKEQNNIGIVDDGNYDLKCSKIRKALLDLVRDYEV